MLFLKNAPDGARSPVPSLPGVADLQYADLFHYVARVDYQWQRLDPLTWGEPLPAINCRDVLGTSSCLHRSSPPLQLQSATLARRSTVRFSTPKGTLLVSKRGGHAAPGRTSQHGLSPPLCLSWRPAEDAIVQVDARLVGPTPANAADPCPFDCNGHGTCNNGVSGRSGP